MPTGNYVNAYGDRSAGTGDGVSLGYGVSGRRDFIWVSLPFVERAKGVNAITWWGDVDATIEYCLAAVSVVCKKWGGDRDRLFLTGFSRGAIACNYTGLHHDTVAGLWRGFVAHSHYDGVRTWPYPGSESRERFGAFGAPQRTPPSSSRMSVPSNPPASISRRQAPKPHGNSWLSLTGTTPTNGCCATCQSGAVCGSG